MDEHRKEKVITIDNEIADEFGCLASTLLRNTVVTHRGADFLVPHESHQDIGRHAGVGVTLGVSVPGRSDAIKGWDIG